jgi:hypothetical protein
LHARVRALEAENARLRVQVQELEAVLLAEPRGGVAGLRQFRTGQPMRRLLARRLGGACLACGAVSHRESECTIPCARCGRCGHAAIACAHLHPL